MGEVNQTVLKYYARKEIQEEILKQSEDREVGASYAPGKYNKRPDILQFPNDVHELAKQGITSFNVSEERWTNPLLLRPGMSKKELDEIRTAWDLIIDIDSDFLEYSKVGSDLVVKALQHYKVPVTIKFSGRAGFHIAVPFEAFPQKVKGKDIKDLFPEAPRVIAEYLDNMIKEPLAKKLLEMHTIEKIRENTNIPYEKLIVDGKLEPSAILHIDTVLISSRHMFRCCYALNDKSLLASIPVDVNKVLDFNIEMAQPDRVEVGSIPFLEKENVNEEQAKDLFTTAYDFASKKKAEKERKKESEEKYKEKYDQEDYEEIKELVPEELFPPCIKLILENGLEDGRKRALFGLVNFLSSCNWPWPKIESRLIRWNKKNKEPLREVDLLNQVRYAKQRNEKILPPNCNNRGYWVDFGVCKPDNLCKKIKNPFSYSSRKIWAQKQQNSKPEKA